MFAFDSRQSLANRWPIVGQDGYLVHAAFCLGPALHALNRTIAPKMRHADLAEFADLLVSVTEADLMADSTLGGRLLLDRSGRITVCYAPFDYIQRGARLAFVGITPGAQQALNGLLEVRRQLIAGAGYAAALRAAKVFASFSGPMRNNLIAMLDHVGLNRWLGLTSTADVWSARPELVHFTSALRYPVYLDGQNYSGSPSMITTPALREIVDHCLQAEVAALPGAVWVPLGSKATEAMMELTRAGQLAPEKILAGLPHPSGANAERIAYFLGRKERGSLSKKTSPDGIDAARVRLSNQVAGLPGRLA